VLPDFALIRPPSVAEALSAIDEDHLPVCGPDGSLERLAALEQRTELEGQLENVRRELRNLAEAEPDLAVVEEAAEQRVLTDPHSAARFRVNGPLSNLPEFGDAFSCKAGAPMRPANTCTWRLPPRFLITLPPSRRSHSSGGQKNDIGTTSGQAT
jgi:hypothetical protein